MAATYEPLNQAERDILEILSRLHKGIPLGNLDRGTIIRREEDSPESYIKTIVMESRKRGNISKREAVWIIGHRGGGKTEHLISLENQLLLEEPYGFPKSAIVSIDLKEYPHTQIEEGLQSEIFAKITATNSSPVKNLSANFIQNFLKETYNVDKAHENVISMGFDILFALTNISIPGVSTIASIVGTNFFSRMKSKYKLRKNIIQKYLESHSIIERNAVELIVRWIRFSVNPTPKNWEELYRNYQSLATEGVLFKLLCRILEATGFSTLVLLFDEVDRLMEGIRLTQAFERLWDPPRDNDPYHHKMNIVFVLAVSNPVESLRDETKFSGFSRRFMGTREVPSQQFFLKCPKVNKEVMYNDDCAHAIRIITNLIGSLTGVQLRKVSDEEELNLRERLVRLSVEDKLTWHELWAAVSILYNPLIEK